MNQLFGLQHRGDRCLNSLGTVLLIYVMFGLILS